MHRKTLPNPQNALKIIIIIIIILLLLSEHQITFAGPANLGKRRKLFSLETHLPYVRETCLSKILDGRSEASPICSFFGNQVRAPMS